MRKATPEPASANPVIPSARKRLRKASEIESMKKKHKAFFPKTTRDQEVTILIQPYNFVLSFKSNPPAYL